MLALAVEAGAADPWPAGAAVAPDSPPSGDRLDLRVLSRPSRSTRRARRITTTRSPSTATACTCTSPTSLRTCPRDPASTPRPRRRATSVYLPGRVDPMLPDELSSDRCSLRAGADRLAVSLALGPEREVSCPPHADPKRPHADLSRGPGGAGRRRSARGRSRRPCAGRPTSRTTLRERRMARGALEIETREVEIALRPGTIDARVRAHIPAHGLIEELMILANRRVAELLVEHRRPALHRVHEPPDAGSIAVLLERLEELGVPTPPAPPLHGGPETARYAGLLERRRHALRRPRGQGRRGLAGDAAAVGQEGALRPGAARPQRARRPPLLPLHLADPPVPGPGLPPRAPGRAGPRRRRAAERRTRGRRCSLLPGRARRRAAGAPRHRDLPGVPARATALRPRAGTRRSRARWSA